MSQRGQIRNRTEGVRSYKYGARVSAAVSQRRPSEIRARPLAEERAHDEISGSALSALGSSLRNIPTPTEGAAHSNSPTALPLSLTAPARGEAACERVGSAEPLEAERNPARPQSGRPVSCVCCQRAVGTLSQGQRRFSFGCRIWIPGCDRQFPSSAQAAPHCAASSSLKQIHGSASILPSPHTNLPRFANGYWQGRALAPVLVPAVVACPSRGEGCVHLGSLPSPGGSPPVFQTQQFGKISELWMWEKSKNVSYYCLFLPGFSPPLPANKAFPIAEHTATA